MAQLFRGSTHASVYAKFRPKPPKSLIDTILNYLGESIAPAERLLAVDVGCGSGQASRLLAQHFASVRGFDTSAAQIKEAVASSDSPNISFDVSSAESLPIEANSVQLLTACQSVHWFDLQNFFKEVDRVLCANGVVALFGYTMPDISHNSLPDDERVSNLCRKFYKSTLLNWSKKERQLVDENLASIVLPFADSVRTGGFDVSSEASAQELKGYLLTWSAYNSLVDSDKESAQKFLDSFDREVKDIFGDKKLNEIELNIHFKYCLLMARKA